jgi:HEPN domain-containing protein
MWWRGRSEKENYSMASSDEAEHLFAAAKKDCKALQGMTDIEVFADEIFGFHAQQAVEKALKSWISFLGIEYPKTHDLTLLLNCLQSNGQKVEQLEALVDFNPYAVQFRYEAFDELGSPLDRNAVQNQVDDLLRMVEKFIELSK